MILAFDTSAPVCAVALVAGETVLQSAQEPMAKGQAERLLVLCQELLDAQGVAFSDLSAIGVGIGPGNFTGIRIAVSAARGLALGLGRPAIGVSSFEALRYGTPAPCAVAIDARRDQYYLQHFAPSGGSAPQIHANDHRPNLDGPLIGLWGQAPAYPIAQGIAFTAQSRLGSAVPRPAPLYLRAADAAPAKDQAPRILT